MGEERLIYLYFVVLNIILVATSIKYDTGIKRVNLGHLILYLLFIAASAIGTMMWMIVYSSNSDSIYTTRKSKPLTKFKIR